MTTDTDRITMTGPETAALAPYLAELHPDDLATLIRSHRTLGRAFRCWRRGIFDCAALQYRIRTPQNRGLIGGVLSDDEYAAAAEGHGSTYLAAHDALSETYSGDLETADAALAALDALEPNND